MFVFSGSALSWDRELRLSCRFRRTWRGVKSTARLQPSNVVPRDGSAHRHSGLVVDFIVHTGQMREFPLPCPRSQDLSPIGESVTPGIGSYGRRHMAAFFERLA